MQCHVYRSRRKVGAFLFVPEKGNFARVPPALMQLFGEPEFSFSFNLTPERQLMIQAEASEVLRVIAANGFFLQLPPASPEEARGRLQ